MNKINFRTINEADIDDLWKWFWGGGGLGSSVRSWWIWSFGSNGSLMAFWQNDWEVVQEDVIGFWGNFMY